MEYQEFEDPITLAAKNRFGITAPLPYQRLVINSTLCALGYYGSEIEEEEPKDRIIILPTGAGKSLCFMLPVTLTSGIVVVIFPLLSLMSDQLRRCKEANMEAYLLRGGMNKTQKDELFLSLKNSTSAILITNMESLLVEENLKRLKEIKISQLVFDEAHTLFEWGEDFRPSLTKGQYIIDQLKPRLVEAFTATASEDGIKKIKAYIFTGKEPTVINANPDRENISYAVIPTLSKSKIIRALFDKHSKSSNLPTVSRPAIIFFRNRIDLQKMAAKLAISFPEIPIFSYHAKFPKEKKLQIEKDFFESQDGILCATNAYGMGVDKANIRTIIHHQPPPTVESYLQESGRAGRDKELAKAILLLSPQDLIGKKQKDGKPISPALLDFLTNKNRCRRESLLRAMGHSDTLCSGCDVCDQKNYFEVESVLKLAKRINRLLKFYPLPELKKIIMHRRFAFFDSGGHNELSTSVELDELLDEIKILKKAKKGLYNF